MVYFLAFVLQLWCSLCAVTPATPARLIRRAERQEPEPSAWPAGPGASALELGRAVSSVRTELEGTLARKSGSRVQDDLDGTELSLGKPDRTVAPYSDPEGDVVNAPNVTVAEPEVRDPSPLNESGNSDIVAEESISIAPRDNSKEDVDNSQTEDSEGTQIKSEDILDKDNSEKDGVHFGDIAAEESEELSDDWVPEDDRASASPTSENHTPNPSSVIATTHEPTTVEGADAEIDAEAEAVEAELRRFEAQERPCQELSVAGVEGYDNTLDCDANAACQWVGPRPPEAMGLGHCWPVCSAPLNQERARCENGGHSACVWVSGPSGEQCVPATANSTTRENDDGAECLFFTPAQLGHQRTLEQCASRVLGSQQCGGLGRFMFNPNYLARDGDEGNCFCCRGARQTHNATRWGVGWDVFVADIELDVGDGDGTGGEPLDGSAARDFDEACAELTRAAMEVGVSQGMTVTVDCAGEAVRVLDASHQDQNGGVLADFLLGSARFHDDARSNFSFELLPERSPQNVQETGRVASLDGEGARLRTRFAALASASDIGAAVALDGSLEGTLCLSVNGSELLTFSSRVADGFLEALEDQLGDSSEDSAVNFTQFLLLVSEVAEDLQPWTGVKAQDEDLMAFHASLERYVDEVGHAALGRRLRAIAHDNCMAQGGEAHDSECWEQLGGARCDSSACHSAHTWLQHNAQLLLQHWEDVSDEQGTGALPPRVRDYAVSFFMSWFADRAVDLLNTV